ncbi:SusC/RagA family TonB-linked outer membrane protein [Pollutibacter soli]|uniref:SusC/RagA family TonB-linked outer membrane protein n=1 Tax=Pollutibacter soli TaxID=3034157 RepID=UPI003013AB8E
MKVGHYVIRFRLLILLYILASIFFYTPAYAQETYHGTVKAGDGSPLAGATIQNTQLKTSVVSDTGGNFYIQANRGNELIISFIGYRNYRHVAGDQTSLAFVLSETSLNLNNVVVIGYGTARVKDLTGAVGTVTAKDFNKGIFSSPDMLVQGKVTGVQISRDNGQPGGASTIKIRGNSALNGTGQPLYVIDGVALDGRTLQAGVPGSFGSASSLNGVLQPSGINPLNFINPDDIASIDILKDASATAIYGSRAAFGVMIINTKKGQAGAPQVQGSISTGVSSLLKKVKVLSAEEFRNALVYYNVSDPENLDKGANTDAQDEVFRDALQQNYTVAVTGGNETGRYRISTHFLSQDGIMIHTGFKKYGMDLSTNFKFLDSKKLGLDINLMANQSIQDVPNPDIGAGSIVARTLQWNPTAPIRNADGSLNILNVQNPVAAIENVNTKTKITTVLGSFAPYFRFTDWLEYKLLMSLNYSTGVSGFSESMSPNAPTGFAAITNSEMITKQVTNTLNFKKNISRGLNLNVVLGYEFMDFTMKGNYLDGRGALGIGFGNYGLDYTNYIQYSGRDARNISSFIDPVSQLNSYFGRAMLNFKDRYHFTGTFRADGSTKFGENNRYGYFPSFAAAWTISREDFFKAGFITLLKLRAGWGITGNQEFPSGSSQAKYSFRDNGSLIQVNSPNPDLKWQSDQQFDIGLDFSMMDDRISGTIDFFHKSTSDLLFPSPPIQPAPPSSVVRWVNLDGEVINSGLEMLINGSIIRGEKLSWDLSVNATFLKNNVKDIPTPVYTGFVSGPIQIIQNGHPMQTFYTRKYLGLDKDGFSEFADDGTIFQYVGNPNPTTLLGVNTNLQYQKFYLVANMVGAFGHDVYNAAEMIALHIGNIQVGNNISRWRYENPVRESLTNPMTASSRFVEKADYFKMSNLTIGYNFGKAGKAFKNLNLYITAQNLFLITGYRGFDPEVNAIAGSNIPSLGIGYPQYPPSRTFLLGINFTLQ